MLAEALKSVLPDQLIDFGLIAPPAKAMAVIASLTVT
jgi:hypothetical protein